MHNIGLIEIKCGNHEFSDLCRIAKTDKTKITAFTTSRLFLQIKEELKGKIDDYEWVIKPEQEGNVSFLRKVEKICNKRIDLVVVNSLRSWEFLFLNPKCKKLSIISNLKWWFEDTKSFKIYFKKLFDCTNITDTNPMANAVSGAIVRKIILSYYDGFIVEYPPFKKNIKEMFNKKRPVYFFPNRPYEHFPQPVYDGKVRFAVPGRISDNRRNYDFLLDVFEKLFSKHKKIMELYLLGEPIGNYGKKIFARCKNLIEKGYQIYCPEGYVPVHFLENNMRKVDVIISPLRLCYRSGTVTEIYTVTKGTGIFSDSIKYAKPCIVPNSYNIADEVKTSYLTYKDGEELQRILESLIVDDRKLKKFKKEALLNSQKFSLKNMRNNFDEMVGDLLRND